MAIFSDLSPELFCQIFEELLDVSAITALSLTSQCFRNIWLVHSQHIATKISARLISNLTSAETLADVQEAAASPWPDSFNTRHQSIQFRHTQVISRLHRLVHNAHLVSLACDDWALRTQTHTDASTGFFKHERKHLPLQMSERFRFERAFYHLWYLRLMTLPKMVHSLALCTPRELCQLDELVMWMGFYNEHDLQRLGLHCQDATWDELYREVSERWRLWSTKASTITRPPETPKPYRVWVFLDDFQEYLEQIPDSWDYNMATATKD